MSLKYVLQPRDYLRTGSGESLVLQTRTFIMSSYESVQINKGVHSIRVFKFVLEEQEFMRK